MPSLKGGRKRQMKRRMRGGATTSASPSGSNDLSGSGSSGGGAADWIFKNFGNGQAQWDNTFGPNTITKMGNLLPTVKGAPAVLAQNIAQGTYPAWTPMDLSGGSRRRKGKGRSRGRGSRKRGGSGFLATAAVPATLFAMQHYYKPNRQGSLRRSTRRTRRF